MARFRGTIQGHRGSASRLGSARSGLEVEANGWDFGVRVVLNPNDHDHDEAWIVLTPGSNYQGKSRVLGTFTRKDLEARNDPQS